nr:protein GAST1-like [Ipomoea batatas]
MATMLSILKFSVLIFVILFQNQASMAAHSSTLKPRSNNRMYGVTEGSLRPQECSPKCGFRCSKTAFKKPCLFFCQKCCAKCLCVPPGTYGNKQVCPCYNNWKTKRGGPKCP